MAPMQRIRILGQQIASTGVESAAGLLDGSLPPSQDHLLVDSTTSWNEKMLPTVDDLRAIPGSWKGDELTKTGFWNLELTETDLKELASALVAVKAAEGFVLEDGWQPMGVTKENFPLPTLGPKLEAMSDELIDGSGAVSIRNFPVNDYSVEDVGIIYVGVNTYIGKWVPQSSAGLRSKSRGFGLPLGRVQAEMVGNTPLGGKQANNYFRLHTDRCDCITLLCIRKAPKGGLSRVASAKQIHNEMLKIRPDLCARLYAPYPRIWEGKDSKVDLPVWSVEKGNFTTQVSPSYIDNAQVLTDFPKYGVSKLSEDEIEGIDLIEEIGLANSYDFMMEPGMVYWLNNHSVYHGRDSWRFEPENLETGRLMLRQWLSPYKTYDLPDTAAYKLVWGDTKGSVARGGLGPCIESGLTPPPPELKEAKESGRYTYYGLFPRKYGVSANEIQKL